MPFVVQELTNCSPSGLGLTLMRTRPPWRVTLFERRKARIDSLSCRG